ncbi:carbonic anhydrase [Spizellomyces sp. 'palustris']|nr:carbonic anhydrase [Spizellomyces sp. 'palustris']
MLSGIFHPKNGKAKEDQPTPVAAEVTTPASPQLLGHLLDANKAWAKQKQAENPGLFETLAQGQAPEIMYIGCSDSRVPPTEIVGLGPGDMFVHRNIANTFTTSDLNLLSVLQYAVEALKVKHIVVCGHYNCGGVHAALSDQQLGLLDNWLQPIKDFYMEHRRRVEAVKDPKEKVDLMCELNVLRTVRGVCHTNIVRNAWKKGQDLTVHAWVYRLSDGQIRDLKMDVSSSEQVDPTFEQVLSSRIKPAYIDEQKA